MRCESHLPGPWLPQVGKDLGVKEFIAQPRHLETSIRNVFYEAHAILSRLYTALGSESTDSFLTVSGTGAFAGPTPSSVEGGRVRSPGPYCTLCTLCTRPCWQDVGR